MSDITKSANLHEQKCVPCKVGIAPLTRAEADRLLGKLSSGWIIIDGKRLQHEFKFKNFKEAMDFTNNVGRLAEEQQHHPDIYLAWAKVRIELWTHKIGGLHRNDFILAAGIDRL